MCKIISAHFMPVWFCRKIVLCRLLSLGHTRRMHVVTRALNVEPS